MKTIHGKIIMENGGEMQFELYPEIAPNTVKNFAYLASTGFYDGLIFHRVIPEFMIQGGDPTGTGMGGPGWMIKAEFAGGLPPFPLRHERGVLSMARAYDPNSAGSQFFIMHQNSPHLDGQYASFGRVIDGLDVLDLIANVETDMSDRPIQEQKILRIELDPAYEAEKPETL
ncbi:MAG: peptidylprolyl isomerase [Eubacteriales bacterium]|nr:peptidylprolyl isomerase [Eubacteriales bacterium]